MYRFLIILNITLTFIFWNSCDHNLQNEKWNNIFKKYKIKGTFILKDLSNNQLTIYNKERSDSSFLPASTFKILNSMIALQTSAIKSVDDTIKWDGKDKGWKLWNKDQTMKSAMPISCVWFYQDLARRIGKEKMQQWINKVNYGNKSIEKEIDNFWLKGDLRITANEQVSFIEKLIYNKLPFNREIQEIVKEIMITDQTAIYTIHSKTGWTKNIGWNVGYVETQNNRWIFVLNMEVADKQDIKFRNKITYEILKSAKIIE